MKSLADASQDVRVLQGGGGGRALRPTSLLSQIVEYQRRRPSPREYVNLSECNLSSSLINVGPEAIVHTVTPMIWFCLCV